MQIAAFAAVQAIVIIAVAPFTPVLAAWSPPLYAVVVGVHSPAILAARLFTKVRFGATLAAAITGVLCGPFMAIGWLILVPLVVAGAVFDAVVGFAERRGWSRGAIAMTSGPLVGLALFAVSIPVFSPDHLTVGVLVAVLGARILASTFAVFLAQKIVQLLAKAGVRQGRG